MLDLTFEIDQLDAHIARARTDRPIGHFSFSGLDDLIGGIRAGRLTFISGEPGVAKTTLLGQMADDAAAHGFRVILNSLEVSSYQLIAKSVARFGDGLVNVGDMASDANPEAVAAAIEHYRSIVAPKEARLNVRLAQDEHAAIVRRARMAGLGASEYVRRRCLQDDNRPIIHVETEGLKKIYRDLRHAGGNLNQCARALNRGQHANTADIELTLALQAVNAASQALSEFITDARSSI